MRNRSLRVQVAQSIAIGTLALVEVALALASRSPVIAGAAVVGVLLTALHSRETIHNLRQSAVTAVRSRT